MLKQTLGLELLHKHFSLLLILSLLVSVTLQSGGSTTTPTTTTPTVNRTSTDPSIGIFPIDCYTCKTKYPDYSYCNNNNVFGACCPEKSTDPACMSNAAKHISCSEDDPNHDFYYSKCLISDFPK